MGHHEHQEETQMSFTKKQIKEINTALSLIVGEVTREQAEAIVRSVMTPSS